MENPVYNDEYESDSGLPREIKWCMQYLMQAHNEKISKERRTDLRDKLLDFILSNGEPDENGNIIWEFPRLIDFDASMLKGMMAQRRVSEFLNEEKARELIEKHHLEADCIKVEFVETIDYDELFAANQKGIISDEELDEIIEISESYALTKIKE
jgi:hypothetical protein